MRAPALPLKVLVGLTTILAVTLIFVRIRRILRGAFSDKTDP